MRAWIRRSGAVFVLAGMLVSTPSLAEPPLWVVRDQDSTLHLFGTIHILKPGMPWRSGAMADAFAAAQEVWLELDPVSAADPAVMQPLVPLMVDPQRPLTSRLTPDQYRRFSAAASRQGVPPGQMDAFRPAFAAVLLTLGAMAQAGYDPESGVDKVLNAERGARPLRTLETMEAQMRFFADLPDEVQVDLLMSTLEQIEDTSYVEQMVQAWLAGDTARLEEVYLEEMRRDHPAAYDVFVKVRNEAWADAIAAEMAKSGTDFVAVGALHLVGPDGLPQLLRARGFEVERVN